MCRILDSCAICRLTHHFHYEFSLLLVPESVHHRDQSQTHPVSNVKWNSNRIRIPSSEFESEKTKLVLWSCFLFLSNVKFCIGVDQLAVGIQIRFLSNVHASFGIRNQSCGRLQSSVLFFYSIKLTMMNPKKQKKKRILMIAMAIIHSSSILLQKKESEKL
jgi:hypothetical protein